MRKWACNNNPDILLNSGISNSMKHGKEIGGEIQIGLGTIPKIVVADK